MTKNQEFFISLLSSHLNNEIPTPVENVNWLDIYKLAEMQNLTALISLEMKKLPIQYQPKDKGKSIFNQSLGLTIQNSYVRELAVDKMKRILAEANIPHTIIKGGAIRHLYPVPEVRTSGDTDAVISQNDKEATKAVLLENGFRLKSEHVDQLVMEYQGLEFQFKTHFDCLTTKDSELLSLDDCVLQEGTTYYLEPTYHLIYVINHLLKHIKSGGFGFRQLMDVDILIRTEEIDYIELFDVLSKMNIEKSSKVVISLSKRLFKTPVDIEDNIDEELYEHLLYIMITGGVFGYGIANSGTIRLANYRGSKFKAIISMLFSTKKYMYNTYLYADKHHILLPIAYIHRLFDAVFKRRKRNKDNLKSILKSDSNATMLADVQKELEI